MLSTNGLNELLKTGRLVQHFYVTNNNDRTVNVFQFLIMHYITDDVNDKDNAQDKQLPFKSDELPFSTCTILSIPYRHTQFLDLISIHVNKEVLFFGKNILIEDNFNIPVWHPPKYS
ncbi:MAG: hypothetical protein KA319_05250 [Ferruginibacter sp.]|nr:hypothetical protein [Ferruginibacter sp.]